MDPKDARIMALATEVREFSNAAKATTSTDNPVSLSTKPLNDISVNDNIVAGTKTLKKWRTKNVGSTVKVDGTLYNWCPHHKHSEGIFDGLYYSSHTVDTHDAWVENQKQRKADKRAPGAPAAKTPATPSGSLQISDALKNALCTFLRHAEIGT